MNKESKAILGQWRNNRLYFSDHEKKIIRSEKSPTLSIPYFTSQPKKPDTHLPQADCRLTQAPPTPWVSTLPTRTKHPPLLTFCETHLNQAPHPRQRRRQRASGRALRCLTARSRENEAQKSPEICGTLK